MAKNDQKMAKNDLFLLKMVEKYQKMDFFDFSG